MISTIESKQQQLINGFYQTGTGKEQILLLESERNLGVLSRASSRTRTTMGRQDLMVFFYPCTSHERN